MNKNLIILIKVMCICFLGNGAYGKSQIKEWEEKACSDLYGSIGLFTHLSDEKWKEKNEKKAAFYASVAANYAIIFETVCKDE